MQRTENRLTRRSVLASLLAATFTPAFADSAGETIMVSKSPTCGCCNAWVDHMRRAGFDVAVRDLDHDALQAVKRDLGIAPKYTSCHTAQIGNYVIEGHVPANDVKRLLQDRPAGLGLAVPGMPIGSPGMEMGGQKDKYDVLLIKTDGTAQVFKSHN